MARLLAVGALTYDLVKLPSTPARKTFAGSSAYIGVCSARLGVPPVIACKVGVDVKKEDLERLKHEGVSLAGVKVVKGKTTSFMLTYEESGRRKLRVLCSSPPLKSEDLTEDLLEVDMAVVSPVLNEIPLETLKKVAENVELICLDPQGYIRKPLSNGEIRFSPWKEAEKFVSLVDVLSTSTPELPYLTGLPESKPVEEHLDYLAGMGVKTILVTCEEGYGVYILRHGSLVKRIPAVKPKKVVDPGGVGDTSATAFLIRLFETGDIERALRFASVAASFAPESMGPYGLASREEVIKRAKEAFPGESI